jgi:hypothetical protein
MGRLGRVQKWVLLAAWDNHASDGEPHLTYPEIKVGHFGMPSVHPARDEWARRGHLFEKNKLKDYGKVSASISRAVHLLAERGLITVTLVSVDAAFRSRPPTEKEQQEIDDEIEAMTEDQLIAFIEGRGYPSRRDEDESMSRTSFWWHNSVRYGYRVDVDPTKGRAEIRLTEQGCVVAKALFDASNRKE